jgi:dolichol-phosphate mannosyltransferase/undecaprenyl-phosphate 4-deoxy-4-formamido-L-arabinose transferase
MRLTEQLHNMGKSHEIILVDDASPDNSWETILSLSDQFPNLAAIRLMSNGGQARATLCGLSHSHGSIVVTMDDDLQHDPSELPKLLNALESDPKLDCVFGFFPRKHHARYRNIGSNIIRSINARAFALPSDVQASSFRAMRHSVANAIAQYDTENPVISALIYSSTKKVKSIAITHMPRYSGLSTYTFSKQFRLAIDNIVNVSMFPLRAVSFLGTSLSILSAVLILLFLIRYLAGQIAIPGWTTVVILLSFFAGVILLSLGIIGEYLVRVLREVRGAPRWIIRDVIRAEPTQRLSDS